MVDLRRRKREQVPGIVDLEGDEDLRARRAWENLAWLSKKSFDAPLAEYRAVRLSGEYDEYTSDLGPSRVLTVTVTLDHATDSRKSISLESYVWGDLDMGHNFSDTAMQPFRDLSEAAARTLSLPIIERGVLTESRLRQTHYYSGDITPAERVRAAHEQESDP